MKSAVETLDPTKVKLTVEVEYDELKPSIEHAYQHIAEQVTIPGFRKGKVPPRIIDQRIGKAAVLEHAVNEGLSEFYRRAVAETEIRPLGRPDVNVTDVPLETEGPLKFTAEVEVRPDVTLPPLESLTVEVEPAVVTDEDVVERLDALRERFGTLVGVDRPAVEGDFAVIDLKAVVGDEEVDAVSGISYQIGSGSMLDGLDEALTGLSAGETTTFTAALAGGQFEGQDAAVTVTATSVKQRDLPAADDDFAQLASEFDTLTELEADLRTQVEGIKASNQAVEARDKLMAALAGAVEVPVPAGVVEDEVHRHLESEGRLDDDEHRAEVVEETTSGVRNQIILDVLAEQLGVQVNQNELLEYLLGASRQYGQDPNEFIKMLDSNNQIPAMVGEVARSKALAVALRQVQVADTSGKAVDLTPFIGVDEEPEGVDSIAVPLDESGALVDTGAATAADASDEEPADGAEGAKA